MALTIGLTAEADSLAPGLIVDAEIKEDSIPVQLKRVELELLGYLLDDAESTRLLLESLIRGGEVQSLFAGDWRDARANVHSCLVGLASHGLVKAFLEVKREDGNVLRVSEELPSDEEHDIEYWWEITHEGRVLVEPRLNEEGSIIQE